jgi:hypothetical protein
MSEQVKRAQEFYNTSRNRVYVINPVTVVIAIFISVTAIVSYIFA